MKETQHSKSQPPRWIQKLLYWRLKEEAAEEVIGDLQELFEEWVADLGTKRARRKYVFNALGFLRPLPGGLARKQTRTKNHQYSPLIPAYMLQNYFKTSWRNLKNNKVFSFINVLGLTIGITVCTMIFLFVMNEFTADNFHQKGDRIYRVLRGFDTEGKLSTVSYLSGMHAPALLNDFKGEISQAVRVSPDAILVTIGDRSFREQKVYNTDPDFFSLFSFPLIKGDVATVLQNPNSVVLTESTAKKYFGTVDNAMGQVIERNKNLQLKVTGIAKNVPSNSHLYFDLVIPLSNFKNKGWMTNWIYNGVYTYVLLDPKASPKRVESRLPQFVDKYVGSDMKQYGFRWSLLLSPLKDVYFDNRGGDDAKHGDKMVVYIFLSIAVLILFIACINFVNLSTIRAVDRSKEVGLRKVLGALRISLIWQFISESVLLATMSCIISVGLLFLSMPWLNQLLGYSLTISWNVSTIWLFFLTIIIVVGFLAGSYPAFFLSAFSPIQALKGKLKLGKGGSVFRQALVVVQFSISVFLIVGTIIITKQMSYVKNRLLGYDKEQTLMVRMDNNDFYKNMASFKTALQDQSAVQSISFMSGEPGGFFDGQVFDVESHAEKFHARTEFTDFAFVKTLGLKVMAGRDFSASFPTDTTNSVMLNKTAAAKLGWTPEQAVGKWIQNTTQDNARRHIIGVVDDFNFRSLKQNIEPLVISPGMDIRVVLIKLNRGHIQAGVDAVEKAYKKAAPAYPFDYSFLDDQFHNMYKKDIRQQTILSAFALLAIFIACLGLFGLASFAASKRFKEIGIRKVLGSSVHSIIILLSKDLLKPVIIATLIAIPLGYWAMDKWLQDFAYKTNLSWWVFCLAAFITFGIALATVCFKAIGAATANPVKSLRAE